MKVYSQLEIASLENLSSDPATLPEGRVWLNTSSGKIKIAIGGAVKELLRADLAQITTYANVAALPAAGNAGRVAYLSDSKKVFFDNGTAWAPVVGMVGTSSTASENIKLHRRGAAIMQLVPGDDATSDGSTATSLAQLDSKILNVAGVGSLPTAGQTGRVAFVTDVKKLYVDDGTTWRVSSSDGGTKNYISGGDGETGSIGTLYADGAAVPVDGTGGSPTATRSTTGTNPLTGNNSNTFVPGTLGDGNAISFTLDREDFASIQTIEFNYEIDTYANFTDGDIQLWIVAPSGAVIQPAGYKVLKQSGPAKMVATFQTESTGTSYKLLIHQTTSTTSWVSLKYEVKLGPQTKTQGSFIGDWAAYTPTTAGLGTPTAVSFYWRRVGSDVEVVGSLITGTVTGSTVNIGLPSGLTSSTSIVPTTIATAGHWIRGASAAQSYYVNYGSGLTYVVLGVQAAGSSGQTSITGSAVNNTEQLSFHFKVPIQGWSSSQVQSDQTDTRVVALHATSSNTTMVSSTLTTAINPTVVIDTHGGYNASTGEYTVKVPGVYRASASGEMSKTWQAGTYFVTEIQVNGTTKLYGINTFVALSGGSTTAASTINGLLNLVAGDVVRVRFNQTATGNTALDASASANFLSLDRLGGPAQIAASESVTAKYTNAAGTSIPDNSATTVPWPTKSWDSHGAMVSNKFYAPISGVYSVTAQIMLNNPTLSTSDDFQLEVYKNGVIESNIGAMYGNGVAHYHRINGTTTVRLLAGEYIEIKAYQDSAGAISLLAGSYGNHVSIDRVGNY